MHRCPRFCCAGSNAVRKERFDGIEGRFYAAPTVRVIDDAQRIRRPLGDKLPLILRYLAPDEICHVCSQPGPVAVLQAAKDAVRPLLLRIAEVLVNAALQLRHGQNHIVTGLLRGRGHFSGRIGHFLCDRFDGLLRAVHHFFPRVRDGLHGLLCGALELFGGAVVDVVGIVGSLHHALDVAHDVARSGKDLLRRFGDGIRQLFGVSSRFGGRFFAFSAACAARGSDTAPAVPGGCSRLCLTFRPAFVVDALSVFSVLPSAVVVALAVFVRAVLLVSFVTVLVPRVSILPEGFVELEAQFIENADSGRAKLAKFLDDGVDGVVQFQNCLAEPLPAVRLVSFDGRHGHIVEVGDYHTDSAAEVASHEPGQLAHVIFQGGNSAIHGLALGVHGVVIAPALLAGSNKGIRQQVIADGHVLDFLHRFPGVVSQHLINVDSGIGKLLDVDCGRFAHIGDLLQISCHAGKLRVASSCSRDRVAQCHDDLAGVACIFTRADQQLVCLRQRIHTERRAGRVLLNGRHGLIGRLSVAQHIGQAHAVTLDLGVVLDAALD